MIEKKAYETLDGQKSPSNVIKKWIRFFIGFFLVWVFMFVIAPWLQKSPSIKPLAEYIEESGIDASALYYTEVEEASEAELNMRSTMEYRPEGP